MAGIENNVVIGAASKIFSKFISDFSPEKVISYADLRWFTGESYKNFGMELESIAVPNYWYFKLPEVNRIHRYSLRKNNSDNKSISEWENRKLQGYDRIWDCGHAKWVYRQK